MSPLSKLCSIAAIIFVISCSVIKTDSNDKEILTFLAKFKSDLRLPSHKLVTLYFSDTKQSRETLIEALEVLKNEDSVTIQCSHHFENPSIIRYPLRTQVTVPVTFTTVYDG